MSGIRIPVSTYRLQFNRGFHFADALAVTDYLNSLGIGDIYASPIFQARAGSLSGYDVTDPRAINPELGGESELNRLAKEIQSRRMGLLLDIVPNHLAADPSNPFWMDVLKNGPGSAYVDFFDIQWLPCAGGFRDQVVLPILGKPYGRVLEDDEIQLKLKDGEILFSYGSTKLPLSSRSAAAITRGHKGQLSDVVDSLNGQKGAPRSFDRLDRLLRRQYYRLAYWKSGRRYLNYRRFFDINDLVGVKQEVPGVFDQTHSLVLRLVQKGKVTGLRVDHIDGLFDPAAYLTELQRRTGAFCVVEKILTGDETLPANWPVQGTTGYDFARELNNVFIYKDGLERLNENYSRVVGQRVHSVDEAQSTPPKDLEIASDEASIPRNDEERVSTAPKAAFAFVDIVYEKKKQVIASLFEPDLCSLACELHKLALADRNAMDISEAELSEVVIEATACLVVYRTYTCSFTLSADDRSRIATALAEARQRHAQLSDTALSFLERVLCLEFPRGFLRRQKQGWVNWVMKWQQFTGPVMAKGLEDTALYNYHPLVSMNLIGASLRPPPLTLQAFHNFNLLRQKRWPHSLSASSTHDTKRSEDVNARVNVLSELAEEYVSRSSRWRELNQAAKKRVHGIEVPEFYFEELIYQTLLGAWPLSQKDVPEFRRRFRGFMLKAMREAKGQTNWLRPSEEYEEAVLDFVEKVISPSTEDEFLTDFLGFQDKIAFFGAFSSLSQMLLKATSPGVPDFYQGTEIWDFSLVDPDNRRPINFKARSEMLSSLILQERDDRAGLLLSLLNNWQDGRIKLYLTYKALQYRRANPLLFQDGEYLPLEDSGRSQNLVAFARRVNARWVIVAVPRFATRLVKAPNFPLGDVWGTRTLDLPVDAPSSWWSVLTDENVQTNGKQSALRLTDVFRVFPLAMLVNER